MEVPFKAYRFLNVIQTQIDEMEPLQLSILNSTPVGLKSNPLSLKEHCHGGLAVSIYGSTPPPGTVGLEDIGCV